MFPSHNIQQFSASPKVHRERPVAEPAVKRRRRFVVLPVYRASAQKPCSA